MKLEERTCRSAEATREVGAELGRSLRAGDLVALRGPMGAGKTTFSQGIARGLNVEENVTSPTFVLMVEYEGRGSAALPLVHLDAYRLERRDGTPMEPDDLQAAGIFDFLGRRDAVKLIEWPERLADWMPAPDWTVEISPEDGDTRRILLTRHD